MNIESVLERCARVREDIRYARDEWYRASDEARSEIRAARSAVREGRARLGDGAIRIVSVTSGELLTGDESIVREVTPELERISNEVETAYPDMDYVHGVGATFDNLYMFADKYGPYVEIMSQDAFNDSLRLDDLQTTLCRGHQGEGMATTRSGRFLLAADEYGLQFASALDSREADVAELLLKLANGSTTGDTSVGAGPGGYAGEWNDDYTVFRILRWSLSRGEISIVRTGANPGGWAGVRGTVEVTVEVGNEDDDYEDDVMGYKPDKKDLEEFKAEMLSAAES